MSSTKNASTPVIDWDSAPEGFPVWIEDLVPFGESASSWARDAGNHYLGVNGSKWFKPDDVDFAVHRRTQSIAEIIEGADRAVFGPAYVVKDCSPVMAAALLEQFRSSMGDKSHRNVILMNPSPVDFQASIKCFDASLAEAVTVDWSAAPEDATHAIGGSNPACWRKVGAGSDPCYWWSDHRGDWYESLLNSADQLKVAGIVARPAPAEKWSLDGKDGTWDYDTLAELIIDCYGHDSDGDGHPASFRSGLYEGDTLHRGIACFDDPVRFLPEAHDVLDHMADATTDSDASEYADNYPDIDDEARAALELALEPLKAWARKHCQPDFFTVKDVTPYILTVEDVQAAKAQERAQ